MNARPNIVFILTDDQGAWALGKDTPELITPNLDRMINEGTRFTNFFCASPVCSPARCSILTGRLPSAHGVHDWLRGGNVNSSFLPANMKNDQENEAADYLKGMPNCFDALKEAGYHMGFVGKWHMGDSLTKRDGFDEWTVHLYGGGSYMKAPVSIDGQPQYARKYVTDFFTDYGVRYIDSHSQDPFALFLHYTAPHTPLAHEEHREDILKLYDSCEFKSHPFHKLHPDQVGTCEVGDTDEKRKYLLKGYYAAITAVDEGVGRIMEALKRNGLIENTVVVFSGDNGMNLGQHGIWGKGNGTYPMNMYDSSVKVPFIVWGPNHVRCGATVTNLTSHYDILPTLREYLLLPALTDKCLPGESFLKELTHGLPEKDRTLCILDEYGPVRMIRSRTHKLVIEPIKGGHQLYDLVTDPGETLNHYGEERYASVQNALLEQLEAAYHQYTVFPFDGNKTSPTGSGQMNRITREGEDVFHPEIIYFRDIAEKQNLL